MSFAVYYFYFSQRKGKKTTFISRYIVSVFTKVQKLNNKYKMCDIVYPETLPYTIVPYELFELENIVSNSIRIVNFIYIYEDIY